MQTSRPIQDKTTQRVLDKILRLMRQHDLAGCVTLVNPHEQVLGYRLATRWSAIYDEPAWDLGFRIRARSSEEGHAVAHRKMEGTAWIFGALQDFGEQTALWGGQLLHLLEDHGIRIDRVRFGGHPPATITGYRAGESSPTDAGG
jgi:hypothetical protein